MHKLGSARAGHRQGRGQGKAGATAWSGLCSCPCPTLVCAQRARCRILQEPSPLILHLIPCPPAMLRLTAWMEGCRYIYMCWNRYPRETYPVTHGLPCYTGICVRGNINISRGNTSTVRCSPRSRTLSRGNTSRLM